MKSDTNQALTTAIKRVLSREVAGFRALRGLRQLTAGASQETWRIDIEAEGGDTTLALRRVQPTAGDEPGVGTIGLGTEARLLQQVGAAGVPVPAVHYVLQGADGLGEGFLMEWLQGETLGQRIVKSDELAGLRDTLAFQCGQALARIHALDWRAAGLERWLPVADPATLVEETWRHYQACNVPVPMIDYTWRWLQDNLPAHPRQCLVHGDFRNGNLMVSPQRIVGVLDWELAHIGDPVRDLGWLCVNSWRFGRRELPVGGFGHTADLLAGYESVSGLRVSERDLLFWQVFGSFWWAMATLRMAQSWRSGATPSLERPVIGRRSSEAQMDCVNLLMPGAFTLPPGLQWESSGGESGGGESAEDKVAGSRGGSSGDAMDQGAMVQGAMVQGAAGEGAAGAVDISVGTQLPMPAELIAGVTAFLKDDVAATDDPQRRFLARVASNSLGIAQRELLHGPALAAAERDRLQALLGLGEGDKGGSLDALRWELVHKLRQGLALDTPGLAEHLRQTVACQLAVDQPRYSALSVLR